MSDPIVQCPKCGNRFTITKALTTQIEKRLRSAMDAEIHEHDVAKDAAYQAKLEKELKKQETEARKKLEVEVRDEMSDEVDDLRRQIKKKDVKLRQIEQREEAVLTKESALDATIRKEVEKAQRKAREEVSKAVSDQYIKRELGYKKTEADLRKKLEEATQKLEQGSQQKQGEVNEQELEKILSDAFPSDTIEPVPQGRRGADIIQHVVCSTGDCCGKVIWESKDVKTWSNAWIPKLKEDQRREKADIAVLVTSVFPRDMDSHLCQASGVWVIEKSLAVGLATALRTTLLELERIQKSQKNKPEKMEVLYQYLMSTPFRQRVEAIVESFISMKDDLDTEKRGVEKQWAKREKQIQMVARNMAGMVGDIHGIDPAFPTVKRLELTSD